MLNYPDSITNEISAYRLNENGLSGYYPIGVGNFWHSGIHLSISSDTPIKPLVSGKVIAYRINKNYQTVDLPQKLSKEKLNEKYFKHKNFYTEKDDIYYLIEQIPSSERKINLASNFILLEHLIQDKDGQNTLTFYTLYTNIGSSSEKTVYQENFKPDGKIHVLTDEEKFFCSLIGPAGYDRDEKYIEISCFMEKSLFDVKFNSNKLIFLSAENYNDFYVREKIKCDKNKFYITNRSRYVVKETITSGNQTAKKIQLKAIAAYLPRDANTTSGKTTKIKDKTEINYVILNSTTVNKNKTGDFNLINTSLDLFFCTCKEGKEYTVTNTLADGQTQILIDCSNISPVWIVDNEKFSSELDKEITYDKGNEFVDYYNDCPLCYSFTKKEISTTDRIKGLTSNTCLDKNKKEYCEIDGLPDTYVEKQLFEKKCYENVSKWNVFFDNQEEFEDDIFCDKLSLLKKIDDSSVIKDIFGANRMISDDEMKMFFGPSDHSLEMKDVVKKLRKIECKHPLEFDKAKFEKIADEYKKRKEWTMGAMSENFANSLKAQTKIRDIWTDGLSKIFKKNNFFFVHPIYFLNHLDKTGLFEFNPYEGYSCEYNIETGTSVGDIKEKVNLKVGFGKKSNPGFAPLAAENKKGNEFPEFGGVRYARCSAPYMIKRYSNASNAINHILRHTGIDLAPGAETNIISFIYGTVWAYTNDANTYGNLMIIKEKNENILYILGHIKKNIKNVGESVMPGEPVAITGGVGPGAVIYPTHLHLEIRECNTNNSAEILDSSKEFNLAPEIKKGTFKWNNKNFGNIYPGPKRFDPFNHDKVYNNLM